MECIGKCMNGRNAEGKPLPNDTELESLKNYRQRWTSINITYFTMFLMSLGFGIIITGVWPFLNKLDPTASKQFMGLIVASNPLGQMLFSPLFGYWSNKSGSIRLPMFVSIGIFTFASGIYAVLELFPRDTVKYWMLFSRFFVGVGSANITICRSYLSDATKLSERTKAVSIVSLAQVLGFIIGPALQTTVTPLGGHGIHLFSGLSLNMYTATGWINVVMGVGNICMYLPIFFKERRIAAKEAMKLHGKESEKETWKGIKPDYLAAWTLISLFFIILLNFVLLETIGTVLAIDQLAMTKKNAMSFMGILMTVGSIVSCLTVFGISPLCRRFKENSVLLWGGFALMFVSRVVFLPLYGDPPIMAEQFVENNSLSNNSIDDVIYTTLSSVNTTISAQLPKNFTDDYELLGCPIEQEWCRTTPALTMPQFISGYALTAVSYPLAVTLIQTIFSKILGPRPQGVWMSYITGAGCLSRIMGPIFVSHLYTRYGTLATFGSTAVMMLVGFVWLWCLRHRIVSPDMIKPSDVEMKSMMSNGYDVNKEESEKFNPKS